MYKEPQAIKELILKLVSVASVSGTKEELTMADTIVDILRAFPYFQANPGDVQLQPIPHDLLARSFVTALVRGSQPAAKTIVLLSHFDVVGIDDYGQFKQYAFQPEIYTKKLVDEMLSELNDEVRTDLTSGDWLFGRGIMDMKAGLGIQLAVLSQLAADRRFAGNILLLATPDEERNSVGMLAAVRALNQFKSEPGLEYALCICSESSFTNFPGDNNKYLYTGSVGKLLPLVFCVGRETHVGEPLAGINATWMAAEIVHQMELSDLFVDSYGDEFCPAPTCLKLTDLKQEYNVQTPNLAYVLYNVLTFHQTPADVMTKLEQVAEQAAQVINQTITQKYSTLQLSAETQQSKVAQLTPQVFTYANLLLRGQEKFGESLANSLQNIIATGKANDSDYRELSVALAAELSRFFLDEGPFYLIMFAPPYYPHVYWEKSDPSGQQLQSMVEYLVEHASKLYQEELKVTTFFPGLSDVSYCHLKSPEHVISVMQANMPLLDTVYQLPLNEILSLNIPTINIGPYGKDAHKHTERLELNFSTKVAPDLLTETILFILQPAAALLTPK